jgi:peroxiredoxin
MTNRFFKRTHVLLWCCLFALVVSCTSGKGDVAPLEKGKAPNFTLTDVRGGKVDLSGFRGRVVVLEFWATWCPPCRESIPELNALYDKYKDKGVAVLAISVDKGDGALSTVNSFMKENAVRYPVLMDDGKTNRSYGVTSIPALFLIDKEGRVVKRIAGFMPGLGENLSPEIERLR